MKIFKMEVVSSLFYAGCNLLIRTLKQRQEKDVKNIIAPVHKVFKNYNFILDGKFSVFDEKENTIQYICKDEILITLTVMECDADENNLIQVFYTLIDTEKNHYGSYKEDIFKAMKYLKIPKCYFIGSSGIGYENGIKHEIYLWNYVNLEQKNVLYINIIKKVNSIDTYEKEILDMVDSITYNGGKIDV